MLKYNKKKYKEVISEETIQEIEKRKQVKCLFGGIFGTYVYDIFNNASDIDFYLIYDKRDTDENSFRYFDANTMNDIYMLDLDYIRTSSRDYLSGIRKYPTILYRDNVESRGSNLHKSDFTSQVIFEVLYSDYIWDSGFLTENINSILQEISYMGVLDYYFSRAYGNLKNNLSKEMVPAVKYLMAFLGYACMKWLLDRRTVPNMDIMSMAGLYLPDRYLDFFNRTWKVQKNLDIEKDPQFHMFEKTDNLFAMTAEEADRSTTLKEKKKAMVKKNESFNGWLKQELEMISELAGEIAEKKEQRRIEKGNSAFLFRGANDEMEIEGNGKS